MEGIFDSHAHWYDKRFETEYEGGAEALLKLDTPSPVSEIVNVGTNLQNSVLAIEQAKRYPGMFAAVGIHPEDCHYINNPDEAVESLRRLLGTADTRKRDKIVAIGEIGLDYHYDFYGDNPLDKKKEAFFFEAQLKLAEELSLPVIIHDREAHGDCFETVLKYPRVTGVFHSYSSSPEMVKELTRRGWYISFSGTLTFKNANRVKESCLAVPRDKLLVETDCPYLAPHPVRGSLNHSGLLVYTLSVLAELWGCTPEEAAKQTRENAKRLFSC